MTVSSSAAVSATCGCIVLPFDCHNHVHMGPTPPMYALLQQRRQQHKTTKRSNKKIDSSSQEVSEIGVACDAEIGLDGMAIMSTHPRDFRAVSMLASSSPPSSSSLDQQQSSTATSDSFYSAAAPHIIPCFGVHPWFLHELDDDDWDTTTTTPTTCSSSTTTTTIHSTTSTSSSDLLVVPKQHQQQPRWIRDIEHHIIEHPNSIVGEIGIDGHRYNPTTGQLVSSIEHQVEAFRLQLDIAIRYQRPVSIHVVRCFGTLMDVLSDSSLSEASKHDEPLDQGSLPSKKKKGKHQKRRRLLPPKLYFHAFGGKVGTVDQILAICDDKTDDIKNNKDKNGNSDTKSSSHSPRVYFGFAPIINFSSPKTIDVIRKVGINRLLLETDHEDASRVQESMEKGIEYISNALGIDRQALIERTTANAHDLYGISSGSSSGSTTTSSSSS